MDELCRCCGTLLERPQDIYPARHVDGTSLRLCRECYTVADEAKKLVHD